MGGGVEGLGDVASVIGLHLQYKICRSSDSTRAKMTEGTVSEVSSVREMKDNLDLRFFGCKFAGEKE